MKALDQSELSPKLAADELILLTGYRRCTQQGKDDAQRFVRACWRQESQPNPTNVVRFKRP